MPCISKTPSNIANESIYIQVGAIHSLANSTSAPLSLIEVQSGSYLGEDDIERLEDWKICMGVAK
jgi:mannose-6-phosphate isomerase-like protein (cupin superfamily)